MVNRWIPVSRLNCVKAKFSKNSIRYLSFAAVGTEATSFCVFLNYSFLSRPMSGMLVLRLINIINSTKTINMTSTKEKKIELRIILYNET